MELNIEHRNSLLAALEEAQKDRDLQKKCLDDMVKADDPDSAHWFEIQHWLALTRIEGIKSAIAKNDIDY